MLLPMPSIKHSLELILLLAQSLVFGMCASAMCLIRHYNLSLNWQLHLPCWCSSIYVQSFDKQEEDLPFVVFDLPLHNALQVLLLPFQ